MVRGVGAGRLLPVLDGRLHEERIEPKLVNPHLERRRQIRGVR